MTDAIVWKFASEDKLAELATLHSVDDCKSALAGIFNLDPVDEKQSFLLDFHLHNYSYPWQPLQQKHFQLSQTSVLLGICQTLMKQDFDKDSMTDLKSSFAIFQSMLLSHSVNRSPKSVGIFDRQAVAEIVDYITATYYRHFQLYKCIFTPHYHVHLIQRDINDVQTPRPPRSLHHGVLHTPKSLPPSDETEQEIPAPAEAQEEPIASE
ncbi:hypothetical protein PHYBOEH_007655 [Phytophthora boehmeriae]|uniref:Uncharacterized protein n=1 Tax=Phytophthora boehmeriae TaxID=109152 RepID=A0A8T1W4W1_9STRA|nr:hypothetical protein PHYBOEH_007655 [Phytophthora boehmeriae]